MAAKVNIEFISDGFREILCSGGVQTAVGNAGQIIQDRANANNTRGGRGFSCKTWMGNYGGGRWVASVSTTDFLSKVAETEDKALSKAVN